MTDAISRFYGSVEDASRQSQATLIELFLYFLTVECNEDAATPKKISECFQACDLVAPANVGARLSEGLKTRPPKYIKTKAGYKLHRQMREALSAKLGRSSPAVQTSANLRSLELKLPDGTSKNFLREAIACFEINANRAAIIMVWLLVVDHLYNYILKHKLIDFNAALSQDRGARIRSISHRDDFSDLKEVKFIELCRAAGIISNDVRKILDQKLGTRNSCTHPSGVSVGESKVIDFVEDIIENVVLKYIV